MPIRQLLKPWALVLAASFAARADDPSWKNKPIEQWDQEDAKQILADSPWVKSAQLQVVRDLSPDERRASGNMEADAGKGVGLAGIGILGPARAKEAIERAHAKPDPGKVVVRWESARPVRAAELALKETDAPAVESDSYAIVVYDVPTPKKWNLAKELQGIAALKRDKKKDLKPSRVEILRKQAGRADIVYLFRRSVEITKKDGYVVFSAQIGRLVLWQPFFPREMQIRDELEL
jgi:hypothetical protein